MATINMENLKSEMQHGSPTISHNRSGSIDTFIDYFNLKQSYILDISNDIPMPNILSSSMQMVHKIISTIRMLKPPPNFPNIHKDFADMILEDLDGGEVHSPWNYIIQANMKEGARTELFADPYYLEDVWRRYCHAVAWYEEFIKDGYYLESK